MSFKEKRIISCGSNGLEITSTNYWQSYHKTESFSWNEITDSEITLTKDNTLTRRESRQLIIEVVINKSERRRLLSWSPLTFTPFDDLIRFINDSTPHLPYIWMKKTEVGNDSVIECSDWILLGRHRSYCKVVRK